MFSYFNALLFKISICQNKWSIIFSNICNSDHSLFCDSTASRREMVFRLNYIFLSVCYEKALIHNSESIGRIELAFLLLPFTLFAVSPNSCKLGTDYRVVFFFFTFSEKLTKLLFAYSFQYQNYLYYTYILYYDKTTHFT